ncbi:hypothetical protein ACWC4J_06715 [Streptomyces sp. NPDC001356]
MNRTDDPPAEPAPPQAPPLDGPLANEDDLDRVLNDWPPAA